MRHEVMSSHTAPSGLSRPGLMHPVLHWTAKCPLIDVPRMLRVHRYTKPDKVRPVIRKAAEAMAQRAVEVAQPQASWRRVPVASNLGDRLILAGGTAFQCEVFGRLLKDAEEVVVFVITLGDRFDAEVCKLIEDFEPLEALFLESAGWLSIERLSTQFGTHLRHQLAAESLQLGLRMGPGYSYSVQRADAPRVMWPLEQQKELFSVFGDAPVPVELMDSGAMRPKMSRSGLFAVLPESRSRPGLTGVD
ncbi:MAG: hypothetical protein KJZ80_06280 [Hyphomicrobiaceae bacterium]|nr:hypothetical protein [Hyphomicrobiaceae bacterium]